MTAGPVAGIDEVGRGPWAGPVVACAVILVAGDVPAGLADSKVLPAERRAELAQAVRARCVWALGAASVAEIDRLNIAVATYLAMRRAVAALSLRPVRLLVDGNRVPDFGIPATAIVGGDASEPAISAASIVAKVARDALMRRLAAHYPGYGWDSNVGYGTAAHRAGLERLGPTVHHRRSFRPVKELAERILTP